MQCNVLYDMNKNYMAKTAVGIRPPTLQKILVINP
jgi:hypothetical protein